MSDHLLGLLVLWIRLFCGKYIYGDYLLEVPILFGVQISSFEDYFFMFCITGKKFNFVAKMIVPLFQIKNHFPYPL